MRFFRINDDVVSDLWWFMLGCVIAAVPALNSCGHGMKKRLQLFGETYHLNILKSGYKPVKTCEGLKL